MARTTKTIHQQRNEEIHVSVFKNIHIHFPGDVYLLSIWVAMSDRTKCTPTSKSHTTLHGLANNFVSLYGVNHTTSLTSEDVLAIFRDHGIIGNPIIILDTKEEMPSLEQVSKPDRKKPGS